MDVVIFAVLAIAFVLGTLAVVGWSLFEMSPFAHHSQRFHDPGRPQQSPRLD